MPAKKSQKQTLDIKKLAELVGRELNEPTQGMTNETKNIPPIPLKEPDTIRPTGIKELDQMLKGGFPNNAIVLVAGSSGCGKTILSMQWLMEGYRNFQDPGLYISLTEPINKMIRSSKNLSFFDSDYVTPGKVFFEDFRTILHQLNLDTKEINLNDITKIVDALFDLMIKCNAKRIVIDSITAIAYRLQDKHMIRTFIHYLDAMLAQTSVNVMLISEVTGDGYSIFGVEEFISDGIIKLSSEKLNNRDIKKMQIIKMRGSAFDSYAASYRITKNGFLLFPRLSRMLSYNVSQKRIPTGVAGLDTMTEGGYFEGSSILVTGSSGSGKSILSLQFLIEGLKNGKKGLLVSFEESRDQIFRNANSFSWDLEGFENKGLLKIISTYPEQRYLEEHIDLIKDDVEVFNPNLVIVDSLSSLGNVFSEDILRDFVSRLNAFLKEKLVTTIYTNATATLLGANQITDAHLSTITDHIIMLRYVEISSELKHALLILKMRGSRHDKKLRELVFTPVGLKITNDFSGLEGVLSGSTHKISSSTEEQLHTIFMEIFGPMGDKLFQQEKDKGLTTESVQKLLNELSDQGVISVRRKEQYLPRVDEIFGKQTASTPDKSSPNNEPSKREFFHFLKKNKNQEVIQK